MRALDWKAIGTITGLSVLVLSWVWQAAKYPTQQDVQAVKTEVRRVDKEASERISEIKREQATIQKDIEYIKESQRRVERGLDKLLRR